MIEGILSDQNDKIGIEIVGFQKYPLRISLLFVKQGVELNYLENFIIFPHFLN